MAKVDDWLTELVNKDTFLNKIEHELDLLEPKERLKVRLELLSYVVPRVKGIDPETPDQSLKSIEIVYVEAKPPKGTKRGK